jgi:hypothetical protein
MLSLSHCRSLATYGKSRRGVSILSHTQSSSLVKDGSECLGASSSLAVDAGIVLLENSSISLDLWEIETELSIGSELGSILGPADKVGGKTGELHAKLLLLELASKVGIKTLLLGGRQLGERVREAVLKSL